MPNTLVTTSKVTKHAVKSFLNELQLANKVDRQLDDSFQKVGNTINIRKAISFTATDGAAISSTEDIVQTTVPLVLNQRKKVAVSVTTEDMTLSMEDFNERIIKPAMEELAQKVESSIAAQYVNIGNFVGTAGTTPSTFLEVGAAGKVLSKLGVPKAGRVAFFDEDASLALANGLKSVFPTVISTKAIEMASIGKYAGFDMYENQSLVAHTVGVATGTPLVNGASQETTYLASGGTNSQVLNTDGWTNSTTGILKAGDVFTIAACNSVNRKTGITTGDLQTFSVTADANSGASTGPAALTITPAIIVGGPYATVDSSPADGAAITVLTGAGGSIHKQNLSFHKDAITLAFAKLDTVSAGAGAESYSENYDGISIRVTKQYNVTSDEVTMRFDVLYGVVCQNSDFACRTTS